MDSRNERILKSILNGTEYKDLPRSRMEALLIDLKELIEEDIDELIGQVSDVKQDLNHILELGLFVGEDGNIYETWEEE